jgi:hypothetical protein
MDVLKLGRDVVVGGVDERLVEVDQQHQLPGSHQTVQIGAA